jgi:hypothetical protein
MPNRVRLRTHGGSGELVFQFVQRYSVVFQPNALQRAPYDIWTSYYQYRILDRNDREIVVYHWEPEGRSPVVTPHLHLSAAGSVILPQSSDSPIANAKTHLNKLHLPTGPIGLGEIVELLIRDFAVVPLESGWSEILSESKADVSPSATRRPLP